MLTMMVVALMQSSGFPPASPPLTCVRQPEGAVVCSRGSIAPQIPGQCDVAGPYRMRLCAPPAMAAPSVPRVRCRDDEGELQDCRIEPRPRMLWRGAEDR